MFIYRFYKQALMTFWYWYVRKLTSIWPQITVEGQKFKVHPGVYKPLENEHTAVQFCRPGSRVLDLGCGSGITTAIVAGVAKEVIAVDISSIAVSNAKENCVRLGRSNVKFAVSDMFSSVEGKFDVILSNPPYLSSDFKNEEEQFATSVRYLPILFKEVHNYLTDDGVLIVQFPGWFTSQLRRLASENGLEITEIKPLRRKSIYLCLLSLVYLQVGFRSTHYVMRRRKI